MMGILLDESLLTTSILAGIAALLAVYKLWRKQPTQCRYPPGPFSLPILGHLLHVIYYGSVPDFIDHCRSVYGNLFTIEIGGEKKVVISGYENAAYVLIKKGENSSERSVGENRQTALSTAVTADPGLLWAPYPQWKLLRGSVLSMLRDEGLGNQSLETRISHEIEQYCGFFIDNHLEEPIDIGSLRNATCNVISELLFSSRTDYGDPNTSKLIKAIERLDQACVKSTITANIPLAYLFKFSGFQEFVDGYGALRKEMQQRMQLKKEKFDSSNVIDIFGHFIQHQSRDKYGCIYTDGNAAATAHQLYATGTETTCTILRWALLYTCLNEDVKDKVIQEIDENIGHDRRVSYADRMMLPYTEAVLTETLRLANIAPQAAPHATDTDIQLGGSVIPAGAGVIINMSSIMHDEKVFTDPLTFDPKRYFTGDVKTKKQRTIPFGIGRRNCVGENLARMEYFLFFVTFFQKYDIRFPKSSPKPSTAPVMTLINSPEPYLLEFTRRYP